MRASWKMILLAPAFLAGSAGAVCVGDCNGDGRVTVDELVTGVNIALAIAGPAPCAALDENANGATTVDELVKGVNNALNGCPSTTPTPSPSPTATFVLTDSQRILQRGPYGVGVTTSTFEDTTRPTNPNGTFPGAATRRLMTEIWYPAVGQTLPTGTRDAALASSGGPYPLIVHSHGFLSSRTEPGFLARHLASHGYIVVSTDYPLTNMNAPGGPYALDIVNQPGDVSFLIDRMLAANQDSTSRFHNVVDPTRIGLSGLSLGGGTTLLATYPPHLRDTRIKASAVMAPAFGCTFSEKFFDFTAVPLMIVFGDIDAILDYQQNGAGAYARANSPKYLVTLIGASHTAFSDVFASPLFDSLNNPDDLGCMALTGALPTPVPTPGGTNPLVDFLGGDENGIFDGTCPDPCTGPMPLPPAMKGRHQHELMILSIFPFFESELRGNTQMRSYLQQRLGAENSDLTVQAEQ